ncbi:hypothetical protein [Listeria sp. ILCC797]|uniref:hypothetical protein n=1 Tax=Listeria sp. ILCC797 TaxID=1918333 RepID=UPI000B5915E5|nr:hypothetical protein [Listeria sp. ILCC797]
MEFLGLLGFIAFVTGIIWLIVSAIRKTTKKIPLIILIVGIVTFFGSLTTWEKETTKEITAKETTSNKDKAKKNINKKAGMTTTEVPYDISKLKKYLTENDFEAFITSYNEIPNSNGYRTEAWDKINKTSTTATGTLMESENTTLYLYIGDYSGQTRDSVNSEEGKKKSEAYNVLVAELNDYDKANELHVGDKITVSGSLESRGDKKLNYNWKVYNATIVQ